VVQPPCSRCTYCNDCVKQPCLASWMVRVKSLWKKNIRRGCIKIVLFTATLWPSYGLPRRHFHHHISLFFILCVWSRSLFFVQLQVSCTCLFLGKNVFCQCQNVSSLPVKFFSKRCVN
jgi:hypothetical protein